MSYRHVDVQSSQKVEVISVLDKRFDKPHFFLLITSESGTVEKTQDSCHTHGEIDIHVRYLFGPLSQNIGETLCHMGGKTYPNNSVRLSNGDILLKIESFRSLNVGSFIFNRIVDWAKRLEGEWRVNPLLLTKSDSKNDDNKKRRNQLYRKFGITLIFKDHETEEEGHSSYDLVNSALQTFSDREWKNISVNQLADGFRALCGDQKRTKEKLREKNRLLVLYKRKSDRFDARIQAIKTALFKIICWPVVIVFTVFFIYSISNDFRSFWVAIKEILRF